MKQRKEVKAGQEGTEMRDIGENYHFYDDSLIFLPIVAANVTSM